ncbi:fibroblast growth factor receptor 2-like [Branchiostoma floridae]|uniref:receptor protein-tyrosine kinase n=1 Tax=Branchiostoma floridae TaxID=7739 RepID=A0A9J7LHP0_BRAFL|nr:fibroblast growth factor receptor 2-like [Branchiostoma floridae]
MAPQGVLVGQQAIINCTINPDQGAAVTWTKDGHVVPDASTTVHRHGAGPINNGRYNEYRDRDIDIVGRASLRIQNTSLSDNGEFYCTVTVSGPLVVGPDSAVLTVFGRTGPPTISLSGTPSTEYPLTLTCTTAGGYPAATIGWYRGDENRTGEAEDQTDVEETDGSVTSSRQYTFTPTKNDTGVSYKCVVSQSVLQMDLEVETTLNVTYPAQITPTPPVTTTVIVGQTANFSCPAEGNPNNFTYIWKEGNRTINSAHEDQFSQSDGVLTISNVQRNQHDVVYTCDVSNNIGRADTASTTLDVQHAPDVSAPENVTVKENDDLTVQCVAAANPAVSSVEWKKQDSPTVVSNNATLSISNIQKGNASTYVCTAQNTLHDNSTGTGTASTVVIVQYAPSKPHLTISASPVLDTTIVTLTCNSTSAVPDPSYTWKFTAQGQAERDVNFGTTTNNGGTLTIHNHGKSDDGYQSLRIAHKRTSSADMAYEDVKTPSEFPRDRLEIKNQLGEGEFGEVYKAEAWKIAGLPGMTTLVVKTVKGITKDASGAFFKELAVLKLIGTHPNVVSFLGYCTNTEPFYLLLEYVSGGSLQSNLRTSRTQQTYGNLHGGSKSLSSRDLTKFAWDVAKGMTFLSSKKILHRDLATRNVLVAEDKTCKVSDFGFSREGDEYERTTKTRLPIRWMAPESLFHRKYTIKTDVWAFGVLLWEIVTLGATPYPGMSKREVMDGVQQGYKMDKPKHCDDKLYSLMMNCWDADPAGRPEFPKIQQSLDSLMETENDYIDLASLDENTYTSLHTASDEKY